MSVTLWTYRNRPPDLKVIEDALDLRPGQYHYLVATTAQQRRRNEEGIRPADQGDPPKRQGDRPQHRLVFHQAVRFWLDRRKVRVMTRGEERILIHRSAAAAAGGLPDSELAEHQIRLDAALWTDALADLASQGIDLEATAAIKQAQAQAAIERLASPALEPILRSLQQAVRATGEKGAGHPFETEAYRLLTSGWTPKVDQIVMEGFTFLTPLQQELIATAETQIPVHLIFPYVPNHSGFATLRRTYDPWWPADGLPEPLEEVEPAESALTHLKAHLFNDLGSASQQSDARELATEDETITISTHRHRDAELHEMLTKIVEYRNRQKEGEAPTSIFVVAPDPEQTQVLLQEAADALGYGKIIKLRVPPRLLLLTPLGRFVLTLYEAWNARDGEFSLGAGQFEELLASGWLGTSARRSVATFQLVRYQWFERASTAADWEDLFARLLDHVTQPTQFGGVELQPARSVRPDQIEAWQRALATVLSLCERLFAGGPLSIEAHIRQLVEALQEQAPPDLRDVERELIGRIQRALVEASEAGTLAVTAEEFGTSLVGLARAQASPGRPIRSRRAGDLDRWLRRHRRRRGGCRVHAQPRPQACAPAVHGAVAVLRRGD